MTIDHDFPRLSIDPDEAERAPTGGSLDERLRLLRTDGERGHETARLNCRLSEALYHAARPDEALECGRRAFAIAPDDDTVANFCAWLFSNCGCPAEAATAYERLVERHPDWIEGYRHLSGALAAIGDDDRAVACALTASDLSPGNLGFAAHAGELLLRARRTDEAVARLRETANSHPDDATLWRLISAAEAQRERPEAALAAIRRALELAPENAEYHLHRGHLLYHLGEFVGAAEAVQRAATLDPTSHAAQRSHIDLLAAAGRMTDATALGGELLRTFPDDDSSAETVLRVLNRRLDTIDGDYVVVGERMRRLPQRRRPPPGFVERLKTQGRVLHALIVRETRTHFGDARLGYGWALIEPILHIALLSAIFSLLMHGQPPIGNHFFLFYYTGLMPYHMFVHTSTSMTHGVTSNGSLLQLPLVTPFDVILARGLLEFATDIVVATLLLTGFAAFALPTMPDDLWGAAIALIVVGLFGCGIGFVNAVLQSLFRSWDKLWANATRLLYFFSGIFYVPGVMPSWARDILAWNPVLQAIDWFRAAFYAHYQPHWLDRRYLVVCAAVALTAGLGLERVLRRRLSEPL